MATSSVISSTRFIRPSMIAISFSRDRHFLLTRSLLLARSPLPSHAIAALFIIFKSRSKGAAAASSPAQSCTWARHNFSMQKMMDLLLRVIVDDNRSEPPKFPDGEGWLFPRHYCVTRWRRPWPVPLLPVLFRCAVASKAPDSLESSSIPLN